MLKRFQIWWYIKRLEWSFKKGDKWDVSLDFLKRVVDGFHNDWLLKVDVNRVIETNVILYFKSATDLTNALYVFNKSIGEDKDVQINSYSYESFSKEFSLLEYLSDKDNKPIDVYDFQMELKKQTIRLVSEMNQCKERSDLQYGYYQRKIEIAVSDLLELYWGFVQIAK